MPTLQRLQSVCELILHTCGEYQSSKRAQSSQVKGLIFSMGSVIMDVPNDHSPARGQFVGNMDSNLEPILSNRFSLKGQLVEGTYKGSCR
jgi:hypothetical protein